jgi:ABC-type glycerol-3-phosphate transport system substrate-binding protein
MKGNLFQVVVIVIFIAAAIFGVLVFSGAIPIGGKDESLGQGTVVLWGTFPASIVAPVVNDFNNLNKTFVVRYIEKSEATFNEELLEALASNQGPDMFFLPDDLAFRYANKIFPIPYASYPLNTFKNVFAGAGEVFLTSKGITAFPMTIDPLMMYYNRSMLDANDVIYPPTSWDEMINVAPLLTEKDESNKINKSAVALGHYSNVIHAKDILATMFMQAGNPIVTETEGTFSSVLDSAIGNYNLPSILKLYTNFADPNNVVYSWNKSFPNSDDAFSAENLAFYFGFSSELKSLINKNPNQNFFVAPFPQIKNSTFKRTGARVTGLAISAFSKNFNTAYTAANMMATGDFASKFALALNIPPARRDLLAVKGTDAYSPVFFSSALFAKSWPDPSPEDTENIFSGMINSVLSNNMTVLDAIKDADSKMSLLFVR